VANEKLINLPTLLSVITSGYCRKTKSLNNAFSYIMKYKIFSSRYFVDCREALCTARKTCCYQLVNTTDTR